MGKELKFNRIDQYRTMWIFVSFDLPVDDKEKRRRYAEFRKFLLQDGFTMLQFSLYVRHSSSRENAEVHLKRIRGRIPKQGKVMLYMLTDKQYGMMENYYGSSKVALPSPPGQLLMF